MSVLLNDLNQVGAFEPLLKSMSSGPVMSQRRPPPPPPSSFKPTQLDSDASLGVGSRTVIRQTSDYSLVLDRTMADGHLSDVQRARER